MLASGCPADASSAFFLSSVPLFPSSRFNSVFKVALPHGPVVSGVVGRNFRLVSDGGQDTLDSSVSASPLVGV